MKLIKGQHSPSWRDKVGDKKIYACPCCRAKGFPTTCTQVTVSYTAPLVQQGMVLIGRDKDRELTCPQCKSVVARRVKGKWSMIA